MHVSSSTILEVYHSTELEFKSTDLILHPPIPHDPELSAN